MKRQKVRSKKIPIILVTLLGLLLIAGGIAFATGAFSPKQQDTIDYGEASKEEKAAGDAKKNETIDQNDVSKDDGSTSQPSGSSDNTASMRITAMNQSAGMLSIRTIIDTVTSSGTCTLSMKSSSGATYSATTSVQALPSSSTCTGFDIPVSELSPGSWTVEIIYKNGNTSGSANETINIT